MSEPTRNDTASSAASSLAPLPTETPHVSTARVATKSALRYLGQLCKHFGHKVPSSLDGDHGWTVQLASDNGAWLLHGRWMPQARSIRLMP